MPTAKANAQFYVGTMIGGGSTELVFSIADLLTDFRREAQDELTASIVGGYEQTFAEYFFVGGEVYIDATTAFVSIGGPGYFYRFQNNLQTGLNILLGVNAGKAGVYVLGGPHWQYWENESFNWNARAGDDYATFREQKIFQGFQVGFGGRYIFENGFGVRGEYRYATARGKSDTPRVENSNLELTIDSPTHEFGLGVTYHF